MYDWTADTLCGYFVLKWKSMYLEHRPTGVGSSQGPDESSVAN